MPTSVSNIPPRYQPASGREALVNRLEALTLAGVPAACSVYVGLAEPGPRSPNHAVVTHTIARHLAVGDFEALPWFNTSPPPVLRILAAASWQRRDAMVLRPGQLPDDLASDLWWSVVKLLRTPSELPAAGTSALVEVLIRLGFLRTAAEVLGISYQEPLANCNLRQATARPELATLSRLAPKSPALITLARTAAEDSRYTPRQRIAFANFVIVRLGKAGKESSVLDDMFSAGTAALDEIPPDSFEYHLTRHTLYRAAAYIPFLRGNQDSTMDLLRTAHEAIFSAEPRNSLEQLSLTDHIFPMFETLAKTYTLYNDLTAATTSALELVRISPWDSRTWFSYGQVLLRSGRFEDAIAAYEKVYEIGGHPVGQAAYYSGFALERLGRKKEALDRYRFAERVDPTVDVVQERIAELT